MRREGRRISRAKLQQAASCLSRHLHCLRRLDVLEEASRATRPQIRKGYPQTQPQTSLHVYPDGSRKTSGLAFLADAALEHLARFQNSAAATQPRSQPYELSLIPTSSACSGPDALRSSARDEITHPAPLLEQCPLCCRAKPKKRDVRAEAPWCHAPTAPHRASFPAFFAGVQSLRTCNWFPRPILHGLSATVHHLPTVAAAPSERDRSRQVLTGFTG
jgi:hypothetical protein